MVEIPCRAIADDSVLPGEGLTRLPIEAAPQ
jgi:hypothetical protein